VELRQPGATQKNSQAEWAFGLGGSGVLGTAGDGALLGRKGSGGKFRVGGRAGDRMKKSLGQGP